MKRRRLPSAHRKNVRTGVWTFLGAVTLSLLIFFFGRLDDIGCLFMFTMSNFFAMAAIVLTIIEYRKI